MAWSLARDASLSRKSLAESRAARPAASSGSFRGCGAGGDAAARASAGSGGVGAARHAPERGHGLVDDLLIRLEVEPHEGASDTGLDLEGRKPEAVEREDALARALERPLGRAARVPRIRG